MIPVPQELLEAILTYLADKPYKDVAQFINGIQQSAYMANQKSPVSGESGDETKGESS